MLYYAVLVYPPFHVMKILIILIFAVSIKPLMRIIISRVENIPFSPNFDVLTPFQCSRVHRLVDFFFLSFVFWYKLHMQNMNTSAPRQCRRPYLLYEITRSAYRISPMIRFVILCVSPGATKMAT